MTDTTKDTQFIMALLKSHGARFYLFVGVLAAIVGWGLYAFYVEYVYGLGVTGDRLPVVWGLNVVNFVYFIAISMAGTIISGILRLSNAEWRKPITRMAEAITVAALPIGALFPLLDLGRPERVLNLFLLARLQSPIAWDGIAIGTYIIASLIYFYLPLIPDLAACRDSLQAASKLRRWLYTTLSLGWSGLAEQDKRLKGAIKIMAILVVPIAVSVHSVLSWVFSVTLRVEWHSTIFPIFFVMGAVYSGVATILIVMYAFRRFYHLEQYVEVKHFLYLAYVFLAADLAMIYLTVSEYMTPSWGAETLDLQYLASITTGPYAAYFWFMIIGGFIIPAIIVSVPRTRKIGLIVAAAVLANLGMWIERFLIVIPSLAVPQLSTPPGITYLPGLYTPSWVELSITFAGLAGFALLLVVLSRLVPIISLWEISEPEVSGAGPSIASAPVMSQAQETEGPKSPGRRDLLRSGAVAAVGLASGVLAYKLIPVSATNQQPVSTLPKVDLSNLGTTSTLEEARETAAFAFPVPSYLPSDASFSHAIVAPDGGLVGLLYSGGGLEALALYAEEVKIAVFQRTEDVINSPPQYLPKDFDRLTIDGKPAFGRGPTGGQSSTPGQIQWWSGGRSCSIIANAPLSELAKIAESMEASPSA